LVELSYDHGVKERMEFKFEVISFASTLTLIDEFTVVC
jgi:hypothetical protein